GDGDDRGLEPPRRRQPRGLNMDGLSIARLRARYRLSPAAEGARPRLDGLLPRSVADGLEPAPEALGIDLGEDLGLRRVRSAGRPRVADGDARLGTAWAGSMADAIRETIAEGGPDVVRYRSRPQALVDLLRGVAGDVLDRTWAWRQLGLWRLGDPAGPA